MDSTAHICSSMISSLRLTSIVSERTYSSDLHFIFHQFVWNLSFTVLILDSLIEDSLSRSL
jgi:hypothetical protein